jgi:hypothetical protein
MGLNRSFLLVLQCLGRSSSAPAGVRGGRRAGFHRRELAPCGSISLCPPRQVRVIASPGRAGALSPPIAVDPAASRRNRDLDSKAEASNVFPQFPRPGRSVRAEPPDAAPPRAYRPLAPSGFARAGPARHARTGTPPVAVRPAARAALNGDLR